MASTLGHLLLTAMYLKMRVFFGLEYSILRLEDMSVTGFLYTMSSTLILFTFIFALLEKVNKEKFVINQSNLLTRKFFGELIDSACASVTVTADGSINFFNSSFRSLILEKLRFSRLPVNILQMFDAESQAFAKLE